MRDTPRGSRESDCRSASTRIHGAARATPEQTWWPDESAAPPRPSPDRVPAPHGPRAWPGPGAWAACGSTAAAVGDELEQVAAGDHTHGLLALNDHQRRLATEECLERLLDGRTGSHARIWWVQRRRHRRGDDGRVTVDAVQERALLDAADDAVQSCLAHLGDEQLRDAVLLHEVDCLADRLARADADQLGDVVGVRGVDHLADPRGDEPLEIAVLTHPLVREELGQVVASGIGQEHDDHVVGLGVDSDLDGCVEREAGRTTDENP